MQWKQVTTTSVIALSAAAVALAVSVIFSTRPSTSSDAHDVGPSSNCIDGRQWEASNRYIEILQDKIFRLEDIRMLKCGALPQRELKGIIESIGWETVGGPGTGFLVVNVWSGTLDGVDTSVWAGYKREDPVSAILRVVNEMKPDIHFDQQFFTEIAVPGTTGQVRIIAAENDELLLRATDGTMLVFNLRTHAFTTPTCAWNQRP